MKYVTTRKYPTEKYPYEDQKWVLIKRRFLVVHFCDDSFVECLGEYGNYKKALGAAFSCFLFYLAPDDIGQLKMPKITNGSDFGEHITEMILENGDHEEIKHHIEIVYTDTVIQCLTEREVEGLKMSKPKYFDKSLQGYYDEDYKEA